LFEKELYLCSIERNNNHNHKQTFAIMKASSFNLNPAQESFFNSIMSAQKYAPNFEQQEVIKAIISTEKNIVVDAKAGTGKTTTLKLIVEAIDKSKAIALIAFNTSIVNEIKEKFVGFNNVDIRTSHSLGMKVLNSSKTKLTLNKDKVKQALGVLAKEWEIDSQTDEGSSELASISSLVDLLRLNLVVTTDIQKATAQELESMTQDAETIADKHDISLQEKTLARTFELLTYLRKDFSQIDFVDMIYFPAIASESRGFVKFPKYDFLLVDECQDLSAAQQALIKKCLKPEGRIIAVGDPNQAIYGFAGADAESFKKLTQLDNTVVLPLNECFRCGKSIIAHVNKTVNPEIRAFEGNSEGEVREGSVDELQAGDFVMCRNTFPLVKMCFYLLARNKAAFVKGKDIGASLALVVRKSKRHSLEALQAWTEKQLNSLLAKLGKKNPSLSEEQLKEENEYSSLKEKFEIIFLIADNNNKIVDCKSLIQGIENLFSDESEGIILSTVHKAKGLEAERCFVIEREKFSPKRELQEWQLMQEANIEYVAYTRAKELLCFISDWSSSENYPLNAEKGAQETQIKTESKDTREQEKSSERFIGEPESNEKTFMSLEIIDATDFGSSTLYDMIDSQGRKVQKLGTINERYFIASNKVEFFAEVIEHKLKSDSTHITIINRVSLEK
jgi:DNA helicase-2/ATP-dependent DNA helicase PcrA